MKVIFTEQVPTPAGHYSQAIEHDGLLFVSGLLPIKTDSAEKRLGTIEEQMELVLYNLDAILTAAHSGRGLVLKTTIYISDVALWPRINQVYANFFGTHRPARAVVPVGPLHYGFSVELEAIATTRPVNHPVNL